jgi:hypothetical protein
MQIIELYIKGYKRLNGAVNSITTNKLIDGTAEFTEYVEVGDYATNQETNETARITAIDSDTQLTLADDIFTTSLEPYRITSDYFRADMFKDESVVITDSLLNVRDVAKVFTPFSKQFNLPASKLNNKLFRHYENTDIVDSFDARYRHDAIIKLNGIDYKKGKIQFNSVQLKNNKAYSYKVTFFSDTVDLKEILGDSKLSSLNYGDLSEFEYSQANILDMITRDDTYLEASGVLNSSDIKVPNIHHSKNMRFTSSGYKDNATGTSLEWTDVKPAIRVRSIIKAINRTFPQINITGFLDSTQIYDVYLWLHRNEGYITNAVEGGGTQIVRNRWKAGIDDYTFNSSDAPNGADVRGIVLDNVFYYYNFFVSIYPTDPTESYTVRVLKASNETLLQEFSGLTGNQVNLLTELKRFGVGAYGYGEIDIIVEVQSENTISMTQNVSVQKIYQPVSWLTPITQWTANYTAVNADTQNTFYTAKQMPEMKVIDFLGGLFKMFNLVVFKQDNDIYTALASWYMNIGNAYDITKYVDMESSNIERLFQYKEMDFKFKSKKSFLVQFADEINGVPFAEEDYGSDEWDGGVYKLEVPFEKMMYERLSNETTGALSDIGQGAMLDKKFEATIGEPLLFCMDYTEGNGDWAIDGSTRTTYWRPTQLTSNLWGGSGNGLALNFGLEMDEYLLEVPDGYDNLFSANYFDYVETVFDRQARMLKVSAYLPLSIITRYRLNDQFIISNKRYRINSIKTNLLTNKTDLELFNKEEFPSQILNDQVAWLGRVANLQSPTKSTDFITVSWEAVSGATGYNIYVNGAYFDTTLSTGIKVNLLESNTWYNITVRAKYNISGNDVFSFDTGITEKTL